jgi:small-conductance mechanosensitive channel/CRP-like cAMP-binding protein
MWLWHNLETTSGLESGLIWLLVIFCASAALLATALPLDRTRVRASVTLFVIALIGLLIAALLHRSGQDNNVYYRGTRIISLLSLSVALVTIGGVIVFDILLSALRLKPPAIVCDLILAFTYLAAALLLLAHAELLNTGIIATSTVVTAAIGLSLQGTLSNVMGGVVVQAERVISVGDWIKVNEHVGVVKEIRWRQTSIETRNWDTVVIPNSILMTSNVVVLGQREDHSRQHRQYVYFNVDHRFAPTEVIAAVDSAVGQEPILNVSRSPAPHCLLMDFKDSYASYAVRYWLTDLAVDEQTDSLIRCRVVFALKRQGINVAIPAYRTFQTEESRERQDRIDEEKLQRRLSAIHHINILAPLNDDERRCLAVRLHDSPFAKGETMARQGDDSHCLYIIITGQAEVRLAMDGSNLQRTVANLGPAEFFGEMGLMTGDKRSANVFAMTDVDCLRLDKEDFIDVLQRRPQIAEAISELLAQRRVDLEAAREHLSGEAVKERLRRTQGDLLQRIRKFFTL